MSRKNIGLLLFGAASLVAVSFVSARRTSPVQASANANPRIAAFTGAYTAISYKGAERTTVTFIQNKGIAVRSDGSSVDMFYRSGTGKTVTTMRIVTDLPNRQKVNVDPFSESITTYPLTASQVAHLSTPPSRCPGEAAGTVLGYQVMKAVNKIPEPAAAKLAFDTVETAKWTAPALNCLILKQETSQLKQGQVVGEQVIAYTDIREGEPNADLFAMPDTYVERAPSQAMAEGARRHPDDPNLQCSAGCIATHSQLDRVYERAQAAANAPAPHVR